MASVTIGHEFFAKEARNYRDMPSAFWRELFQNSVDAGASNIKIDITNDSHGVRVVFSDNGVGMSKHTLQDVFFSLGNTTKASGSIGGYGKARIILCFAQQEYSIRTQNIYVAGSAGEYEIDETLPYVNGCTFSILINPSLFNSGVTVESIASSLKNFLSLCQFQNINISINGVSFTNNWMYKRNAVRQLSFGTIYHNKSKNHPYAVVRVAGVAMFQTYIGESFGQVIIELSPDKSRNVLTSNRDGMTSASNEEFMKFISEITIDKNKALRNRDIAKKVYKGGARYFSANSSRANTPSTSANKRMVATGKVVSGVYASGVSMGNVSNAISAPISAAEYNDTVSVRSYSAPATVIDPLTSGMVLVNRATRDELLKAMPFYDPINWTYSNAARRKQILKQWTIAVEAALWTLCQQQNIDGVDYRIGWYFDDDDLACHQVQDDGSHALLLNPIHTTGDKIGRMKYGVRSMDNHVELVSYACHEAAHIIYGDHDAGFARMYTYIVTDTMKNMDSIHKSMLEILK